MPQLVEACEITTSTTDFVDQLEDLCLKLRSKLSGRELATVVLRLADFSPVGNRSQSRARRLMIEGALCYVCRELKIKGVHCRDGSDIGKALSMSKAEADKHGEALSDKHSTAAAAALSGLPPTPVTTGEGHEPVL